jgi:uncharacterized Ntn-hydrolase superfamily protein
MIAYRQLAIVDRAGCTAAHSGERTLGTHVLLMVTARSRPATCSRSGVPAAMVAHYAASSGRLFGERLIGAMQAGLDAGGGGPIHSIGLKIAAQCQPADLRVDWHDTDRSAS